MKKLAIIAISAAALSGCATYYPAPANYGTRAYAQPDADGWQVVSVTPVAPGTGAAASASGDAGRVTYSPAPTTVVTQPVYVAPPVYAPAPIYAPAPVYADPLWYPPISIGLGFSWSHWSGGHRGWGHRGGWRHR
ncbi:hypothetical protein SAMN05428966_103365 [Massilia sp. PDC64]|nr:hypothetical protein [Massilia sp. PDC64]SDD16672.1 hypothetical protein SAMN05428966_103365 [Massilia sp. PDC64]